MKVGRQATRLSINQTLVYWLRTKANSIGKARKFPGFIVMKIL